MTIAIRASAMQKMELINKGFNSQVEVQWLEGGQVLHEVETEVLFDLLFDDVNIPHNDFLDKKLVFIHGVSCTCAQLQQPNYIRLNAWPGFVGRPLTELACTDAHARRQAAAVFDALGWKYVWVKDEYGLIAARIIAMIINEAWFALSDEVSTADEVDTAMKLGTNYPFGPFEWCEKIGADKIIHLLKQLSPEDGRYLPCPAFGHKNSQL